MYDFVAIVPWEYFDFAEAILIEKIGYFSAILIPSGKSPAMLIAYFGSEKKSTGRQYM
ncbi:MAG: hypothetical protein SFT81_06365 [Candidatus Caenarcaniphilales bacterium]|nr:hypothetical protein [Candidatus Caenarcaniphilales bacterium]